MKIPKKIRFFAEILPIPLKCYEMLLNGAVRQRKEIGVFFFCLSATENVEQKQRKEEKKEIAALPSYPKGGKGKGQSQKNHKKREKL